MKKYGKFWTYIFIPELHKSSRIHFHGITFGFSPLLIEARNPKTDKLIKRMGCKYNAETWKDGFSTMSKLIVRQRQPNLHIKIYYKKI